MSDPVRVAVVGCGNVSDMHFVGYLNHPDKMSVVAACDPSEERRAHVGTTYGITATFGTLDELLDDADFTIAVVCTPSHVRLETVRQLAAAGKHILVEKPMAETLAEAREIVDVCAAAGVSLSVDQNFRDHYAFGLARDVIRAGTIGAVFGIDHRELMFREVQGWRADATRNALSVMGVHWFDGFRYLLDDDADWLNARTHRAPSMNTKGETDAFVQITFGPATVDYTQSFSSRVERVETIVFGEKGTLALTYDTLEISDETGATRILDNPFARAGKPESAYRSLERLIDALDTGAEPSNSGRDNLKTLSLLFGAYESAGTGRPVTFEGGVLR